MIAHLLVGLVVVVGIFGVLNGVLDELLQSFSLAYELNELRDTATAAQDN